jgi:hypothetical protein
MAKSWCNMDTMENTSVFCITQNLMRKVMNPPWIENFLSKEKVKIKYVSLYIGQQLAPTVG